MKNIFKLLLLATGILFMYSSCKKVDPLPFYNNGKPVVLSSSVNVIAPATADSSKAAVTFLWTNPDYANDSATTKYIIQIDSSGRDFSKAVSTTITGKSTYTFIAKELNAILLSFGFAYNKPYDVDIRVVSSYSNNNEQYKSNTLKLKMTPYVTPPKVVPPVTGSLFIIGAASAGGWGNPVPAPAQQFKKIDSVTYEGTFFLNGSAQYLLLPENGSWDHKFAVQNNSIAGLSAGGDFGFNEGTAFNDNFPGPAASGMYKIKVDFQSGKFSVVKAGEYGFLYVPGSYQAWKPETAPSIGSAKNDGKFDGYINITENNVEFKFTATPDWSNGIGDKDNGTLVPGGGDNLKFPGAGYYRITADLTDKKWSATKTSWGLVGSFAASNWTAAGDDVPMVYNNDNKSWTGTITTVAGDKFKFRANNDWGINLGETNGTGSLSYGGDDIGDPLKNAALPAGTHKITLYLSNSGYYTYLIQ
jgi:starch-binding outer membrane protein SusE/F